MARPKQDEFVATFNRLLGDRRNSPTRKPKQVQYDPNLSFSAKEQFDLVESQMKEANRARKAAPAKKETGPTLTREERRELNNARLKEVVTQGEDDLHNPWWKRTLDVLTRPIQAGHGALTEGAGAIVDGEPFWSIGDDIAYGAAQGFAGQRNPDTGQKYGFGDMTDEFKREDSNMHGLTRAILRASPATRPLVDSNEYYGMVDRNPDLDVGDLGIRFGGTQTPFGKTPDLNVSLENMNRAVGFMGEALVDPYLGVGGKALKIAREGGEVVDAEKLTQIARKAAQEAAESTGAKLPSKSVPVGGIGTGNKFIKGSEGIADAADDFLNRAILQIRGGGQGGKLKFDPNTVAPAVGNAAAEAYRSSRLQSFETKFERFVSHIDGGNPLTVSQLKNMRKDPIFRKMETELLTELNKTRKVNPYKSIDEVFTQLSNPATAASIKPQAMRAATVARSSVDDEVVDVLQRVQKELASSVYGAPGVRIGSKVVPLRRVGKAYDTVRRSVGKKAPGLSDTGRALSYEKSFPGRLSLLSQKTRGMGIKAYDSMYKDVRARAKQFNRVQRESIRKAIDTDTVLSDPILEAERQWFKRQYREMALEEQTMGVRSLSDRLPESYQYVRMRGGSKEAREKFRQNRKKTLINRNDLKGYQIDDAKKLGLRPVTDPYEALLFRKMDSNNALTRAWFKTDLLDHYGVSAQKLSVDAAIRRNLVEMPLNSLPETLKAGLKEGEKWYLPKEIKEVLDKMTRISKVDDKEAEAILRLFDNITNKFKTLVTVPYPGFHVRNMIGDVFMGYFDGVRWETYKELFNKSAKFDALRKGPSQFKIADGVYITRDELIDLYTRNAASGGFYSADLGTGITALPNKFNQKLRDVSEYREDFGRLAHFLHALREEYPAVLGKTNRRTALQTAVEQSVYRVNKYKFDYGALTGFERNFVKRVVPFYTYTRKAFPTLLEAMFLTPKNLSRVSRIMEKMGGDGENFNTMLFPNHIREIGYATLTDEETPWILESSFLPTSVLDTLVMESPKEAMRAPIATLSPLVKAPFEVAAEKEYFSERPIDSTLDYAARQFGPYSATAPLLRDNKTSTEKFLSSRWTTGLPFRQVSQRQQDFRAQDLKDSQIDIPFRVFNGENEDVGVRVYMSNRNEGTSFRVANTFDSTVLGDFQTPAEALQFAQRVAAERK